MPLDAQDLQVSSASPDEIEFGYANREPLPPKGSLSNCHVVGITKSELSGHPLKAEEIHEGSASWPPLRFAWAQPKLGRLEVVSTISGLLPGKHQVGSYSYNFSTAHLTAAYPLMINVPRKITISAQPWFSGLMGHGSCNSFQDVSGYSASITLSAKAIVGGDQDSYTVVPDNSFGLVLGFPIGGKVQYWPTLSVNLKTTGYDFLLITLTLTATTIQKAGSDGYALIDIDGATKPPGKSHYYGTGCLDLPGFVVKACIP